MKKFRFYSYTEDFVVIEFRGEDGTVETIHANGNYVAFSDGTLIKTEWMESEDSDDDDDNEDDIDSWGWEIVKIFGTSNFYQVPDKENYGYSNQYVLEINNVDWVVSDNEIIILNKH